MVRARRSTCSFDLRLRLVSKREVGLAGVVGVPVEEKVGVNSRLKLISALRQLTSIDS